ncbi:hypothetical protein [Methylobacterium nigriterrae]|uniref:hypothetical protein n=1 Tax=Methylobacterium nigriterrae TaxID=3127512 RepID=UPI00301393E3
MAGQAHEAFAGVLRSAWELAQAVRDETGTIVELRLTTLGLTALASDAVCGRMATVSWHDLARADDLPGLLSRAIREVAGRPGAPA